MRWSGCGTGLQHPSNRSCVLFVDARQHRDRAWYIEAIYYPFAANDHALRRRTRGVPGDGRAEFLAKLESRRRRIEHGGADGMAEGEPRRAWQLQWGPQTLRHSVGEYFQASVHIFNAAFPRHDLLADLADLGHLTLRFTADVFPRFSSISYSSCCPSLSVLRPARSTAEI